MLHISKHTKAYATFEELYESYMSSGHGYNSPLNIEPFFSPNLPKFRRGDTTYQVYAISANNTDLDGNYILLDCRNLTLGHGTTRFRITKEKTLYELLCTDNLSGEEVVTKLVEYLENAKNK